MTKKNVAAAGAEQKRKNRLFAFVFEDRRKVGIIVLCLGFFLTMVGIVAGRASADAKLKASNNAEIARLSEELASLQEEADDLSYILETKTKDEIMEEEARKEDYIYPGETGYYNITPGAES